MTTTTSAPAVFDEAAAGRFAQRVVQVYVDATLALMIDLGHRVGLFEAAADGPCTSSELAGRAGLSERCVREWLGAMVTTGVVDYDAATTVYHLPPEHAACFTGSDSRNIGPLASIPTFLGKNLATVATAFRVGGGVPYEAYHPEFTQFADAVQRRLADEVLIELWVPLAPGLTERLTSGIRVADIGCGAGHRMNLLARAFPRSTFVGYDVSVDAVAAATAEVADYGLANATFRVLDVADISAQGRFDAIFAFDSVHDLADPGGVLRGAHDALAVGGIFFMLEPHASSRLEDNVANPIAPLMYAVSSLHCLQVSLVDGGAGLGMVFGEQNMLELLRGAGFVDVAAHPAPKDPLNAVYVATRS